MLPSRKRNRLRDYDYSENGAYFITVCTKNRTNLLGCITPISDTPFPHNTVGAIIDRPPINYDSLSHGPVGAIIDRPLNNVRLSSHGKIVKTAIENISSHYPMISVEHYVIMPNHIHLLLLIQNERGRSMIAPTISTVIQQLKGFSSKLANYALWQKSFHDRIIRNQQEFDKIWEYIDTNPLKWELDCFYNPE